jgi:hypothetical protein
VVYCQGASIQIDKLVRDNRILTVIQTPEIDSTLKVIAVQRAGLREPGLRGSFLAFDLQIRLAVSESDCSGRKRASEASRLTMGS